MRVAVTTARRGHRNAHRNLLITGNPLPIDTLVTAERRLR